MSASFWCAFLRGLRNALLRVALSVLWCGPVLAGSIAAPSAVWNQGPAPFIPLYTCDNQLAAHFSNTVDTIKTELVQAAEEWFIGSGSNIRFYYFGTLTANDPACADMPTLIAPRSVGAPPDGPPPPRWSVVLTAAPHLTNQLSPVGSERCHYAVTDLWEAPPLPGTLPPVPGIERARIALVRGQMCGGNLEPWPWPDPSGPQPPPQQTLSPARVLMKMLGHALGLGEESGTGDTVMAHIDPSTFDYRWHLSEPIVEVMRSAYGPARSSPYWAETKDQGQTWQVLANTPRGQGNNSLGLVACQVVRRPNEVVSRQSYARTYLVAETSINSTGKSFVTTYFVDAQRHGLSGSQNHGQSNRKPSILCGTGFIILGFVDPTGAVRLLHSTDGVTWSDGRIPAGSRSAHAPILAEAKWADGIVAATSTCDGGLQFLSSRDGGLSYRLAANSLVASQYPPRFPFGLVCPAAKQHCYAAFSHYTPADNFGFGISDYRLQGGTLIGVSWAGLGEIPNLGLAMAPTQNGQGYVLARRYRPGSMFSATPNTALDQVAAGVQADAAGSLWTFTRPPFSRSVSDSPIGLFRDGLHRSFIVVGTWNYWYNGFGFVVASAKQKAKRERAVADAVRGSAFERGK